MRVLGMISGTSHDGIDIAVVDFALDGSRLHGRIVHTGAQAYPDALRARLAAALPPAKTTLAEVCELDTLIGQSFAEAAASAIADAGPVALIVSHGQTVYHWVDGGHALGTLQIGQPAWIAERTATPVLSDVRIRDITAGGHGAPLVSYLDSLLLAGVAGVPAALNLGGIANISVLHEATDDGLVPPETDQPGTVPGHGRVVGSGRRQVAAGDSRPANSTLNAAVAGRSDRPTGPGTDEVAGTSGTAAETDRLTAVGPAGTHDPSSGRNAPASNGGGSIEMSGNSARRVTAYDIGPANALIDAAVARHGGHPAGYDQDGAIAASGSVHEGLLAVLLNEPYYRLPAPKSTGKELFHLDYIDDAVRESGAEVGFADLVATLTELTVRTVADDVRAHGITTLLVSGGGARNPVIMDGLRSALSGTEVLPSDAFGAPSDDKEAIAFALIGWCTAHGLPGSDPAGTGARSARVLGTLTPGAGPLVMPAPLTTAPESLTLETGA